MEDTTPAFVKYGLLIAVPAILVLLGLVVPFVFKVLPRIPLFRIKGMGIFFKPRYHRFAREFDTHSVERFILLYCEKMPQAFGLLGIQAHKAKIEEVIARIHCHFVEGPLKSELKDRNLDGKTDVLTGLTHDQANIEVGILSNMVENGKLSIHKTAMFYEMHNACIWALAGYEVAMGEVFVDDNDERILPWLGGKSVKDMKKKRAVLDSCFEAIKAV